MHRMIHSIALSLVVAVTLVGMMPIAIATTPKPVTTKPKTKPIATTPKTDPVKQDTVRGGKRGPGCEAGGPETFLSIVPTQEVATTSEELPTIWVHVPHAITKEKPGYFQIKHNGEYRRFSGEILTNKDGAIGIRLPANLKMKQDDVWEWRFILKCTGDSSTANPEVVGKIQFKPLSARAKQDLAKAKGKPDQQAKVYSANGFWLDAVTIAGQNNATMKKQWASLLNQEGLSEIKNSSIVKVVP